MEAIVFIIFKYLLQRTGLKDGRISLGEQLVLHKKSCEVFKKSLRSLWGL